MIEDGKGIAAVDNFEKNRKFQSKVWERESHMGVGVQVSVIIADSEN